MSHTLISAGKALLGAGAYLARGAVDLVYPPHCLSCGTDLAGRENVSLCRSCRSGARPIENGCATCGTPLGPFGPQTSRCRSCRDRRLHFDLALGAFQYDGPVKRLLHRLKFEGFGAAAGPLAELALEVVLAEGFADDADVLVPVPLHWKRRIHRGYNQSERIASALAKMLGKPCVSALVKAKATDPQMDLSRKARHKNPVGTVSVGRKGAVAGKRVLLVDDVMTTAATVSECARALKEAGARRVVAFAIARQA